MIYGYITLADETEIVHTELLERNGEKYVEVHFECPIYSGFKSARCELPSYKWLFNDGFSDEEISFFTEFLHHNAHLIFKYAANGGSQVA